MIAAAGSGQRLGAGGPKAFLEVAGRPLLHWALAPFAAAAAVGGVVIAAPRGAERRAEEIAAGAGIEDATAIAGGERRSQSVAAALERVDSELVVVHDAARPLVTAELIDAVLDRLALRPDADAVIAATPITDTVKRAREPRAAGAEVARGGPTVARTESRDHLWAAQTPQAFRAASLREALAGDPQRVAAATDEAMLIEKSGGKVLIVAAPAENLKVTTPADLRLAELLLRERSR